MRLKMKTFLLLQNLRYEYCCRKYRAGKANSSFGSEIGCCLQISSGRDDTGGICQRLFGESKVQELLSKKPVLPEDIEWHFIGHLQTNKVKQIVPFVSMIHSADSPKLLQEINKTAENVGRVVSCLLQIHIAREESKFGFSFEECRDYLRSGAWMCGFAE